MTPEPFRIRIRIKVRALVDHPEITTLRQQLATARRKHKRTAPIEDAIYKARYDRMRNAR